MKYIIIYPKTTDKWFLCNIFKKCEKLAQFIVQLKNVNLFVVDK